MALDAFQVDAAAWSTTATSSRTAEKLRATEEEDEQKEERQRCGGIYKG